MSARAVVFVTKTLSDFKAWKIIRQRLELLTVERRELLKGSKFQYYLEKNLMVKDFPIVFIGGRYIGGLHELEQIAEIEGLVDSLPPVVESGGLCHYCGGHKFVLDRGDLITCTACSGTGFNRDFSSRVLDGSVISQSKLYLCFQAADNKRRQVYLVCSVEGSSLATHQTNNVPVVVKTENSFHGYHSMGCGLYDSKIIFAGGELPLDHDRRYNGIITFDMKDASVAYNSLVPPMNRGKLRPLVFQLNKRLYVFDREYRPVIGTDPSEFLSIEFYSPAMKTHWAFESNFLDNLPSHSLVDYACLVFGKSFLISVPGGNVTVMSHANYLCDIFVTYSDKPLPFTGMATFYSHADYEDFVMIYFKEGIVRVCKFDFSGLGDSKDLFTVKSGGEDMCGYFADFGKGSFCLTAFDKSCVYVYTFSIARVGTPSGPLDLTLWIVSRYVFSLDDFCKNGEKITRVLGCFSPLPNEEAKSRAEEVAFFTRFKKYRKKNDDYDPLDFQDMGGYNPFYEDGEPDMESLSSEED